MTTIKDVAAYMVQRQKEDGYLYQEVVVYEIAEKFGEDFVYTNDNGNLGISKQVLKEFNAMTPDLVWDKGEKAWRERNDWDDPNSRRA